jgi:hypothetical protein
MLVEAVSVIIDITFDRLRASSTVVLEKLRLDCQTRCEWTAVDSVAHIAETDVRGIFQLS